MKSKSQKPFKSRTILKGIRHIAKPKINKQSRLSYVDNQWVQKKCLQTATRRHHNGRWSSAQETASVFFPLPLADLEECLKTKYNYMK